jgi:hypothetical protein
MYERFEETAYNTAFVLEDVKAALAATGWGQVYFARLDALAVPLADPEQESRVFVVATRS